MLRCQWGAWRVDFFGSLGFFAGPICLGRVEVVHVGSNHEYLSVVGPGNGMFFGLDRYGH